MVRTRRDQLRLCAQASYPMSNENRRLPEIHADTVKLYWSGAEELRQKPMDEIYSWG